MARLRIGVAVALAVFPLGAVAHADDARERAIEWRWADPHVAELLVVPIVSASAVAVRLLVPLGKANWTDSVLLDEAAIDLFANARGAATWGTLADALYFGSLANAVIDPMLAGVTGNWDTAAQLLFVNLEAYGTAATLLFFSQLAIRRSRPHADVACENGGDCSQSDRRSFPGGHLTIATTNALLTCQAHTALPLYGSRAADLAACGFWSAGALTIFFARMIGNEHHLSDQMMGLGVGFFAGYVVPQLLRYIGERPPPVMVAPLAIDGSLGVQALGAL